MLSTWGAEGTIPSFTALDDCPLEATVISAPESASKGTKQMIDAASTESSGAGTLSKNTTVLATTNGSRPEASICADTLLAGPRLRPLICISCPGATPL
jgi:hypothetical protein